MLKKSFYLVLKDMRNYVRQYTSGSTVKSCSMVRLSTVILIPHSILSNPFIIAIVTLTLPLFSLSNNLLQ